MESLVFLSLSILGEVKATRTWTFGFDVVVSGAGFDSSTEETLLIEFVFESEVEARRCLGRSFSSSLCKACENPSGKASSKQQSKKHRS